MQAAKTLADASKVISGILGETSLVDSLNFALAARPLHGLLKANATVNIFGMPMTLTLTFQWHALQLINTFATGTACKNGKSLGVTKMMGAGGKDTGAWAKSQDKAIKAGLGIGFGVAVTKGKSGEGEGLGPFIKNLMGNYVPAKLANSLAEALKVFDKVELGLLYTGGTALLGLTDDFALPAPFATMKSGSPGLHIKASISSSILPTRNTDDCDIVCDLMHAYFEATGGDGGSSLSIMGSVIVSTVGGDDDAAGGDLSGGDLEEMMLQVSAGEKAMEKAMFVKIGVAIATGNFQAPLLDSYNENGDPVLACTEIKVSVKIGAGKMKGEGGGLKKGTYVDVRVGMKLTWIKPKPKTESISACSTPAKVFPCRADTSTVKVDATNTLPISYFDSYGGKTIDFEGDIRVQHQATEGKKPSVGAQAAFKMKGLYMNAYGSDMVHFGDLTISAGAMAKMPWIKHAALGGRGCFGKFGPCALCLDPTRRQCDAAIAFVGYLNVAIDNPYVYAFLHGDLSVEKIFKMVAPGSLEKMGGKLPLWLNAVKISGLKHKTRSWNADTKQWELTAAAPGAGFSFSLLGPASILVTGADGEEISLPVPEGLQMQGRVTLFPGSHLEWGCDLEYKVGDLSTIIGDFSFALQCDPLDVKVGDASVFKIEASSHGTYKETDVNSCPDGFKAMTEQECKAWADHLTPPKTYSKSSTGNWKSKPKG